MNVRGNLIMENYCLHEEEKFLINDCIKFTSIS